MDRLEAWKKLQGGGMELQAVAMLSDVNVMFSCTYGRYIRAVHTGGGQEEGYV